VAPLSFSSTKLTFSQLNSIVTVFWSMKYRFGTAASVLSLSSATFVLTRVIFSGTSKQANSEGKTLG